MTRDDLRHYLHELSERVARTPSPRPVPLSVLEGRIRGRRRRRTGAGLVIALAGVAIGIVAGADSASQPPDIRIRPAETVTTATLDPAEYHLDLLAPPRGLRIRRDNHLFPDSEPGETFLDRTIALIDRENHQKYVITIAVGMREPLDPTMYTNPEFTTVRGQRALYAFLDLGQLRWNDRTGDLVIVVGQGATLDELIAVADMLVELPDRK